MVARALVVMCLNLVFHVVWMRVAAIASLEMRVEFLSALSFLKR